MLNLGMPEILLVLVVALLVFGPRKLPEMGKSIGQALREFRKHTSAVTDEFRAGALEVQPVTVNSAAVSGPTAQVSIPAQPSAAERMPEA